MNRKEIKFERKKRKLSALLNLMEANELQPPEKKNEDSNLEGESFEELKSRLRMIEKQKLTKPLIYLTNAGKEAEMCCHPSERSPLFVGDIQSLLMYSLIGDKAPFKPRWCNLVRWNKAPCKVVVVVEGLSCKNLEKCDAQPLFPSLFPFKFELLKNYEISTLLEMWTIPISTRMKQKLFSKYGNFNAMMKAENIFLAPESTSDTRKLSQSNPEKKPTGAEDAFPRTQLLLSLTQMIQQDYPLPLEGPLGLKTQHFVPSKSKYSEVNPQSPMYGVDCEMCRTTHGSELTSVAVVNEKHDLVYHSLVQPRNKIVDYLTRYSGITHEMLENVTTRIEEVQKDLSDLLPGDAILVGQSLNSDLNALQIFHPYVIDTSVIYNLTGCRSRKSKLALLMELFLREKIQTSSSGHDPREDSSSALKLAQLKLKYDIAFGDAVLRGYIPSWNDEDYEPISFSSDVEENHFKRTQLMCSIVKFALQNEKKIKYIGPRDFLSLDTRKRLMFDEEDGVALTVTDDESEVFRLAYEETYSDDLLCIHWRKSSVTDYQEAVKFIDRNIQHLHSKIPSGSLIVVVVSGITSKIGSDSENGICFVKIKE